MSYGRVTPGMLRHMAMLVEMGSADGEYLIEYERDNDYDYLGEEHPATRYMNSNLDRYILEFRVSPNAPSARSVERQVVSVVRSAELPQTVTPPPAPVVVVKPPPPIDYKPAIELFVEIVKVIIRAWTMDGSKIRFGLLEL